MTNPMYSQAPYGVLIFYRLLRYPIIKTPINEFLTNEEILPIIHKDALMSLVRWSQAHGQKLKPSECESKFQPLAEPSHPSKKPSDQLGSGTGSAPIDETNSIERGLS
jgi:hypothetical protein